MVFGGWGREEEKFSVLQLPLHNKAWKDFLPPKRFLSSLMEGLWLISSTHLCPHLSGYSIRSSFDPYLKENMSMDSQETSKNNKKKTKTHKA